jgi:asparagine synthase (glutamine-hydrolysing)
MSAIAGILGQGSLEEVRNMVARMSYRGPAQRVWSPAANVYFGEVGYDVGANSQDTIALTTPMSQLIDGGARREALAEGLNRDLIGCLRRLHGDFALAALGDDAERSVVLAVDQMAYRSLYVMRLPSRWIFASDYKALLALADCPATVDRDVLQYYLRYGRCPLGESLLAGAYRLVRGQMLRLQSPESAIESYVDPAPMNSVGLRPCTAREIREKLEAIVLRQLQGHARVAVTLSAGFDSTALVALVRHVRPDIQIASYTIGHGPDDPEILGAKRSAEYFKTEHHVSVLSNPELERLLPQYVWLTENLNGRGEAILQQQIARQVARKDKFVMAGHAADMVFGGMPRHRLLWIADRSPPPVRGALRELFVYAQIRTVPRSWLGRRLVKLAQGEEPAEAVRILGSRTPEWPERSMTLNGYRSDQWVTDSFGYHDPAVDGSGLTMVSPFADPELRDLALGLPGSSLVNFRQQKRILRESMADLLPDFLLRRPKAIQKLRQDDDLSRTLRSLSEALDLDRSLADRGLIARDAADSVLRGRGGQYTKTALNDLWGLICAELWMRSFCDHRGAAPVDLAKR